MPVPSASKTTHFAQFATTSRLLSCLVTEGLLHAYMQPLSNKDEMKAVCLIYYNEVAELRPEVIHSVIPLKGIPIIDTNDVNGLYKVELLDPMDMLPAIYTISSSLQSEYKDTTWIEHGYLQWKQATYNYLLSKLPGLSKSNLSDRIDGAGLWTSFAEKIKVSAPLVDQIAKELNSSIINQRYIYEHPRSLPSFKSSFIEWEQCVFEGHATHPVTIIPGQVGFIITTSRFTIPPMPSIEGDDYDLAHPNIRIAAIPRSSLILTGSFEKLLQPMMKIILEKTNNVPDSNHYALIPVHELQLPNIKHLFKDIIILPEDCSVQAQALTSLRSVVVPEIFRDLSLKLCVGMKVSSAMRTITPFTTYFGPRFSEHVVPRLTINKQILQIERELASACYKHDDFDVAKHCSCVVRDSFESRNEANGETVVVCAALVEKCQTPDSNVSLVENVWGLDTEEKKIKFLDRYIKLSLEAFLPPCLHNGVAFEAHGQNTLARFDSKTKELIGFTIRDFGGIKGHQETLMKSCGVKFDVLPDSCVIAEEIDGVYKLLYHTLIYSHLHRLIRVLGMHYNGLGWSILRRYLKAMIPQEHPLYKAWLLQSGIPGKCLMQMKIDELYRDDVQDQETKTQDATELLNR
ncbi:hypothetical protein INT43_007322 [Umbelopsis isabellina]|uniref:IucC family-domain-containing protein n=1 Tax=Mortierella isabellina TaxID=91625 RepID=A0A8H7UHY9_MORIS|nr:hypothetical protein INT43_007322 [Umbelopsis isabellina]